MTVKEKERKKDREELSCFDDFKRLFGKVGHDSSLSIVHLQPDICMTNKNAWIKGHPLHNHNTR